MCPSIAARFFCSSSTSKKPPQLAYARFQILSIGDGDFRWHRQNIIEFTANRKKCCGGLQSAVSNAATLFAIRREFNYVLPVPTEISIPDAEDLKSRVRELRRFL